MASFTKLVCFFFLLITLQIHARDSHFFSKVSRSRDYITNPNHNYYNNQDNEVTPFTKQQYEEEQPSYTPQNTQESYGLFGHDTGLDPPTATSTSTSISTATIPSTTRTSLYKMDGHKYENQENFNNNENYENDQEEESYEPNLEGLSETFYTNYKNNNVSPRKYVAQNNYNNNNNVDNKKNYGDEGKFYGGVEKQGMSDTRYLENGKYFYDISAEKNLNNDLSYNYNNNFNNNNNNLNNENNGRFYGNKNNYYYNGNGNGNQQGYNNRFSEGEFDFDDQP
ncbi:hypothetical protein vseg_008955 [Gypsophila vaccaria]